MNPTWPENGIFHDVPYSIYRGLPRASRSVIVASARSPAHAMARIKFPKPDNDTSRAGRAIHVAVLEPDEFSSRYVVAEPCAVLLKSGQRKGEPCGNAGLFKLRDIGWACGTHVRGMASLVEQGGQEALDQDEWDMCIAARDSVRTKKAARAVICGVAGRSEITTLWTDPNTGIDLKARQDWYDPETDGGVLVELKSAEDARHSQFEKAIFNFSYHNQLSLYRDGLVCHDRPVRHCVFVAVEKEPPYAVGVYRLDDEVLRRAAEHNQHLMERWAWCVEKQEFPGYPDRVQDISIPRWAWEQMDINIQRAGEE